MDVELLKEVCGGTSRRCVEEALLLLAADEFPEAIVTVLAGTIADVLDRAERRDKPRAFKKAAKKIEPALVDAVRAMGLYDGSRWVQTGETSYTLAVGMAGEAFAYVEYADGVWCWRLSAADGEEPGALLPARSQIDARWTAETAGFTPSSVRVDDIVRGGEVRPPYVLLPLGDDETEDYSPACAIVEFMREDAESIEFRFRA